MTALRVPRSHALCERGWSLVAFAACLAAEGTTAIALLGSGQDLSTVRWWLLELPLAISALPVVVPRREARIAAVVAMAAWSSVASVWIFFLPAAIAMVTAATRPSGDHP